MKSTDPHAKNLVEKSKLSGVKIIGNLADVSNLMTSSSSPRNSAHFSSSSPRESADMDADADPPRASTVMKAVGGRGGEACDEEWDDGEEEDIVHEVGPKGDSYAAVMVKHRSLERGGSLKPPPRQNSVKVS